MFQGAILVLELIADLYERVDTFLESLQFVLEHFICVISHVGNIEPRGCRINRETRQMSLSNGQFRHSMGSFAPRNPAAGSAVEFVLLNSEFDHNELDAALRRCGSSWTAGQAHGLLCGRLAAQGNDGGPGWMAQVLEGADPADPAVRECESVLERLLTTTHRQLAERQSAFAPLLADDDEPTSVRASSMAHWCEGFLHGLVAGASGRALQERLASEPLSEIIRDLGEITRAEVTADDIDEEEEAAYSELVEYLRVAAQLAYEELADVRAGREPPTVAGDPGTIH